MARQRVEQIRRLLLNGIRFCGRRPRLDMSSALPPAGPRAMGDSRLRSPESLVPDWGRTGGIAMTRLASVN
jgi:hypothetical protein